MLIINYEYRIYCFNIGKIMVDMSYLKLGMTVVFTNSSYLICSECHFSGYSKAIASFTINYH